jgi:hypothetical protein
MPPPVNEPGLIIISGPERSWSRKVWWSTFIGQKHLFTERDARRILKALWTKDDPIFIPHRYRIQFHYIFLEYLRTGARLGAFFSGGLRYNVHFSWPVYDEDS